MNVSVQLRTERLTKTGQAPLQLTFTWDGQRLRLPVKERAFPKDWNPQRQRLKAKPGTYADEVNLALDRYTQAAESVHHAALQLGQVLAPEAMKEAILAGYQQLVAEALGLPEVPAPPAPPPPTFTEHYTRWLGEQTRRVNLRTGQRLSKTYLDSLANSLSVLEAFAEATGHALSLAGMSPAFYQKFQNYFFELRGQGLNTFGKHVRALKTFLAWAEDHDLDVNPKYRKFAAPDQPVGADALTERELLAVAQVDFFTEEARQLVRQQLAAFDTTPTDDQAPRRRGVRRSQVDDYRVLERLRTLERARDKFLQCAYLALRISDANRLAPRHLDYEHQVVRIKAGKTQLPCVVPFLDDHVFRPVALIEKYRPLGLPTCLPVGNGLDEYLPVVAQLAGLTRIALTSKVGRKTFVTLKLAQGVPRNTVMQATGHKTESSFNRYAGIDETELVEAYRKTARVGAKSGGSLAPDLAQRRAS